MCFDKSPVGTLGTAYPGTIETYFGGAVRDNTVYTVPDTHRGRTSVGVYVWLMPGLAEVHIDIAPGGTGPQPGADGFRRLARLFDATAEALEQERAAVERRIEGTGQD